MKETKITGYKGFDKDMKCRGFQFEEGKEYKHDGAVKACSSGFHFCEHPLDVFGYYPPNTNVFYQVEGSGKISKEKGGDSKVSVSNLKIGAKLSLSQMIIAAVDFTFKSVKWTKKNTATGDCSGASATGNYSGASATGYKSGASATGYKSGASATGYKSGASVTGYKSGASVTGDCSGASATGNYSGASVTGYKSGASATGDCSGASATGDCSGASATGNYSGASATGDCSGASATGNCSGANAVGFKSSVTVGKGAVGLAVGFETKGKGKIGSWIVLTETYEENLVTYVKDVKVTKVDGKKIKEDTFYMLKNGKFVVAPND